ncbi:formin-like protein 2 [Phragmites australis]|uniref:formin-like protein 2 n=1 Tax=Phragmites australis TaxID=29695 RepID=UPI002D78A6C3|nr:formin-like protein 2 [Phragmites australis]
MPAAMSSLSRRLLLCLFLIACFAGLLFSITGNGKKRREAGNGHARFRLLRDFNTLGLKQKQKQHHGHGVSPAPAPAHAHLPLLHKDARLPVHGKVVHNHERGNATAQSPRDGGGEHGSKNTSTQLVAVAAAAALSGAVLVLLAVLVVFLTCKRFQGRRGGADLNGTNKVSFEPGPGLLYLDTIKPYLEAGHDDGRGKAPPEMAGPKHDEPKCEGEGSGGCSDDGAESVHSSCCFQSSHFSYSELRDAKGSQADGVSPSPSGQSKRRSSAPTTPSDKKVADPYSPLCPRTPSNEDRGRRAHSPSSSVTVSTAQLLKDHELQGTCQPVKSLKFESGSACHVKEAEAEADTVSSDATGSNTVPPVPPPPPPVVKQQQNIQTSCGGPAIPLPPPPPPLLVPQQNNVQRSSGPGLPPPPAPPGLFRQSAPVGKNGAPLPKLKPLHWDKVRAAPNRRMVWDRIRSSSFELDEKMIESLFGYNAARRSAKHEEAQIWSPSLGHHVLDPKRLQNITILMKALDATAEQIYAALLQGSSLSVQQLEALIKMAPTKEEVDKLSSYDGDVGSLVPAERLLKVVLTIPSAFARVEAMLYRETFADEVGHIKKSFAMLEDACRELMSSKLFLKLLEAVLKTGNRMNVGTARGGAMAFKLDALLKLADVKGTDGKTTLLHFVVQEMIRSQKPTMRTAEGTDIVTGLAAELTNVKKTATVDLDVLTTSVCSLSHGLSRIKELVGKDLSGDERSQCFVAFMAPFVGHAEEVIRELEDGERRVLGHVRDITEYYHGDVGKDEASPLRIFVIVRDFLTMLERVCKEVRRARSFHGSNPPCLPE